MAFTMATTSYIGRRFLDIVGIATGSGGKTGSAQSAIEHYREMHRIQSQYAVRFTSSDGSSRTWAVAKDKKLLQKERKRVLGTWNQDRRFLELSSSRRNRNEVASLAPRPQVVEGPGLDR